MLTLLPFQLSALLLCVHVMEKWEYIPEFRQSIIVTIKFQDISYVVSDYQIIADEGREQNIRNLKSLNTVYTFTRRKMKIRAERELHVRSMYLYMCSWRPPRRMCGEVYSPGVRPRPESRAVSNSGLRTIAPRWNKFSMLVTLSIWAPTCCVERSA